MEAQCPTRVRSHSLEGIVIRRKTVEVLAFRGCATLVNDKLPSVATYAIVISGSWRTFKEDVFFHDH